MANSGVTAGKFCVPGVFFNSICLAESIISTLGAKLLPGPGRTGLRCASY